MSQLPDKFRIKYRRLDVRSGDLATAESIFSVYDISDLRNFENSEGNPERGAVPNLTITLSQLLDVPESITFQYSPTSVAFTDYFDDLVFQLNQFARKLGLGGFVRCDYIAADQARLRFTAPFPGTDFNGIQLDIALDISEGESTGIAINPLSTELSGGVDFFEESEVLRDSEALQYQVDISDLNPLGTYEVEVIAEGQSSESLFLDNIDLLLPLRGMFFGSQNIARSYLDPIGVPNSYLFYYYIQ